ncbi:hypothetical protein V6N12_057252 [Hibiscus sabdariffa]|uniref:Cation/H+ exchanger domain-containing protein n=1 Tax=Hibiscus sabdariffa TaxID=183260 RepID=A0ABR2DBD5_9ROSI
MVLSVAVAGIMLPLLAGVGLHSMVLQHQRRVHAPEMGAYFWSIALSGTSFPDLARILSGLKLMYTDLGKTALTAATFSDLSCGSLLVVAVCLINGKKELYLAIPVMVCMTMFLFTLHLFINKIAKQISVTNKEAPIPDKCIYFILSLVLLSSYITKLCGVHSIFRAFMLGLMIPGGKLGTAIKGKVEEFVVILVTPLAFSAKILSTFLVFLFFKCPMRDGLALGVLMNTKGVLVLIVLNEGRNMNISLLQISNATRKSPITVFSIYLVKLTRASAMLIFHDKNKNVDAENNMNTTREKAEAEQIVNAFESFENDNHATAVQTLTTVSPYASMQDDVNNFALDKFANIILISFHKRPDTAGGWTDEKLEHKLVNQNLLTTPPCSIGTPHLILTLVCFVPGKDVFELIENVKEEDEAEIFTIMFEREKQK